MSDLEWKNDPAKLAMLKRGETAVVGEWILHIDYLEPSSDFLNEIMLRGLTGDERMARLGVMESERTHPYLWRVDRLRGESSMHFTGLSGRAKNDGQAKFLAATAVEYARLVYASLNLDEFEKVDWFGDT